MKYNIYIDVGSRILLIYIFKFIIILKRLLYIIIINKWNFRNPFDAVSKNKVTYIYVGLEKEKSEMLEIIALKQ